MDSESQLFKFLPTLLLNKIECSVYNRRKRKLFYAQYQIRKKLAHSFHEFEEYFIVDSMPLEVYKLSRTYRSEICRESFENSPNRGYCASQSMCYFGYKLHVVCLGNEVIANFDLSKASVHDIHHLKNIEN